MIGEQMSATGKLRRLGYGEARMHFMHSMFRGTTQGAFAVRVEGALDVDALVESVRLVKARHAMLRVAIEDTGDDLYYVPAPSPEIPDVELRVRARDGEWLAEMRDGNHVVLDSTKQLWRLVVIIPARGERPVFDLILFMHHAAMDAGGADTFFHEVLTLTAAGGRAQDLPPSRSQPPPAAETSCASTCTWDRFQEIQRELLQSTLTVGPMLHRAEAPLAERRTTVVPLHLDEAHLGALAKSCEREGVTFNSFVSAALLAAVKKTTPERTRFALYTALSLRRLCAGISELDFGCYLSVLPTFHELAGEVSVPKLAAEHQLFLQRSFLLYGRPPADHDTRAVREGMKKLASIRSFINDIGFTYAESRLHRRYGALRLVHVHVAANRSAGNVALVLHGLKLDGEVFFTLSHTEPLQDARWANDVQAELQRLLGAEAGCS